MARTRVIVVLVVIALAGRAAAGCPARVEERGRLPGVGARHEQLAYWLRVVAARHDLDRPLLSVAEYDAMARRIDASAGALLAPVDTALVEARVAAVLALARRRLAERRWLDASGGAIDPTALSELRWRPPPLAPALHVVLAPVLLRCVPLAQVLHAADDVDREDDVNACSTLRAQEVVQVLAEGPGTLRLVRTRYAFGWIGRRASLSPPIPRAFVAAFVGGERVAATRGVRLRSVEMPARTSLPLAPGRAGHVLVGTPAGVLPMRRDPALVPVRRRLTRRAVLEAAFAAMGRRYGFGGTGGGVDCSALLLETFAAVGMELPRHSADQAQAGTGTVDLRGAAGVTERLALLDAADRLGIVVLHLPGHVALYLGRDAEGVPMALHALGGYRTPCPDGASETRHVVRRVVVSRLDLGAGTREGSMLERVDTLAVFGRAPGAPR